MAFTLVSPAGGWSFNATFTSAQANQLAADVFNALDKSIAGDQLAGVITFASTGQIAADQPDAIVASVENAITVTATQGINAAFSEAITATEPNGIFSAAALGISTITAQGIASGVAGGIVPTVAKGISDGGVVGGIAPTVAGGINDGGVAGGLATSTAGGFVLGGGVSDWPTFSSTRGKTRIINLKPNGGLASGWSASAPFPGVTAPGTATSQFFMLEWSDLHQGSTMQNFDIFFIVGNNHSGGAPGTYPSAAILRYPYNNPGGYVYLNSSSFKSATNAGSGGSGWYASGAVQFWNYLCNQNNVIDTTQYVYMLQIIDENGSNAEAGNQYLYANPNWVGIPNMAFP